MEHAGYEHRDARRNEEERHLKREPDEREIAFVDDQLQEKALEHVALRLCVEARIGDLKSRCGHTAAHYETVRCAGKSPSVSTRRAGVLAQRTITPTVGQAVAVETARPGDRRRAPAKPPKLGGEIGVKSPEVIPE